jgi:hypothetical protein
VHTLAVFNVETLVDINKIAKLDAEIVTCNLVDLYAAFFDIVGAQTDEDGIPPFLPAKVKLKVSC